MGGAGLLVAGMIILAELIHVKVWEILDNGALSTLGFYLPSYRVRDSLRFGTRSCDIGVGSVWEMALMRGFITLAFYSL
jgi:hypothetical protein